MKHKKELCTRNFGFVRKTGILMAISSLPSPYGIGTMGDPCLRFIDFLAECRQTCWQVLPLNPTAYGDSPYQSPAAMAGNPYFIDLDTLAKQGLLTKDELAAAKRPQGAIDYGWLYATRFDVLRQAYARFTPNQRYYYFWRQNREWLDDYALFMALKVHYGFRPWNEWDNVHKHYASAKQVAADFAKEMGFWRWVQYEFAAEWQKVRRYAQDKGVRIIGDMPIYVAYDSVDVWSNPDQFLLDGELRPTLVAGCPPDYFSQDGQLWGNPIYNWDRMKEQGYSWWIARVKRSLQWYDLLRIDHFRGFAGYYVIPFGSPNARNGWWQQGPGKALFDALRQAIPDAHIIAEDLGTLTPDVYELLDYTGLPGMKILQFAFGDDPNNPYLPVNYTTDNCVVYTGSHDNDCTKHWFQTMSDSERRSWLDACPRNGRTATYALIHMAMASRANLSIIPMQDYLELDSEDARMNVPSRATGNWTWRASNRYAGRAVKRKIVAVTVETHRATRRHNGDPS